MGKSLLRRLTTAAVLAVLASAGAKADGYPSGPVTLVVGYAAGGSADTSARFVAKKLEEAFGAPFVVENRPGASGLLGAALVAQSKPDGQTLMYTSQGVMVIAPIYNKETPIIPHEKLIGVVPTGAKPVVLVIDPDLPVNSVQELIDYAKANPGKLSYGSGGLGTSPHLAGAIFSKMAGIEMQHITYGGENPAVLDVLGKRIQVVFASAGAVMPHVEAGKLRALGVTSDKRLAEFPDLPTIDEAGLPGYNVQSWSGVMAPVGTPKEIVDEINEKLTKALMEPDAQKFFQAEGIMTIQLSPEEFQSFIEDEAVRWPEILKD